MRFYLSLLLIFLFVICLYAKDKPHSFSFMKSGKDINKKYCQYCHKLKKSSLINPEWGKVGVYEYFSPANYEDLKELVLSTKNLNEISAVCLACHQDYQGHNNNIHPVSVAVTPSLKKSLKPKIISGKANNKLPLFGTSNTLECATCHDPHTKAVKLLRDIPGELCQDCHDR